MALSWSNELCMAFDEAERMVSTAGETLSTALLLQAFLTAGSDAGTFLMQQRVDDPAVYAVRRRLTPEPLGTLQKVVRSAERMANRAGARELTSVDVLNAFCRQSQCEAYELLDVLQFDIQQVRSVITSLVVERSSQSQSHRSRHSISIDPERRSRVGVVDRDVSPKPIEFHPALQNTPSFREWSIDEPEDGVSDPDDFVDEMWPDMRTPSNGLARLELESLEENRDEPLFEAEDWSDPPPTPSSFTPPPPAPFPRVKPSTQRKRARWGRKDSRSTARKKKRSLGLLRPQKPSSKIEPKTKPRKASSKHERPQAKTPPKPGSKDTPKRRGPSTAKRKRLTARESQEKTASSLADRLFVTGEDIQAKSIIEEAPAKPKPRTPLFQPKGKAVSRSREKSAKVVNKSGKASPIIRSNKALADRFKLPARTFPNLCKFGTNLLVRAVEGHIDPVIGREAEIAQLTDILNKRRSNNPILVGAAGVGKTAIVEGLALKMIDNDPPPGLRERVIISLDLGSLISGTQLRGSFQERLIALRSEVRSGGGKIILFLDEIHTWLGQGKSDGSSEAASELKPALARGELPCIGATTTDEFKRFVESDPAFERRFDVIDVRPPDIEESTRIIQGIIDHYSEHHRVQFSRDAIDAAVRLSDRFIRERQLPDKAIGVLDRAGAVARRLGRDTVGREEVATVISDVAEVPSERLLLSDRERFLHMEETLQTQLIGHTPVISTVARVIRRNYAGFSSNRPIGSFLFLGPTGVGKTELVKVLADFLFGSRNAFVRLDMSEYMESHAVARLIGAPPGYVGFEDGGQLTEAVRRKPYQVILLDEVEKAHPEILNILLQLLDEGRLTDGRGRTVDFSNSVIVMTSNLGAAHFEKANARSIGFASGHGSERSRRDSLTEAVCDTARKAFPVELWGRIEERLVFQPLSEAEVAQIAALQLKESARRLESERGVRMTYEPSLITFLIEHGGFDPRLGARPMRQTIQRLVESAVAEAILQDEVQEGERAHVIPGDGRVVIERHEEA